MESRSSSSINRRGRASSYRRDAYLRRFQLLRYHEVMRLCDVMEAEIPIHGAGNFPTLKIRPCKLVQLVRERLELVGIKVHDIRLNGSAATHVLSDATAPGYNDLDLIFTIDFPGTEAFMEESGKQFKGTHRRRFQNSKVAAFPGEIGSNHSPPKKPDTDECSSLDDSGYTSSGSSVGSDPASLGSASRFGTANQPRSSLVRTSSLESFSSSSMLSSADARLISQNHYLSDHQNWQEIKEATMDILHEFLPDDICHGSKHGVFLGNAYVRKMVKVMHNSDRWSLISLNNNSGRNLELKFVQKMKRQFEFSVDSFQIILDTYLAYRHATVGIDGAVEMREGFHPTVVAESVYGDFAAAMRHLRHRRIWTHRPEEIRGGGLLRYCNLLARGFLPGEDGEGTSGDEIASLEKHMCARFFIDFDDIERQRRKLIGYLDGHFHGEDELKFQYLLVLRQVVSNGAACLMQHERAMIVDLLTALVRETFARNVANHNIVSSTCNQQTSTPSQSCSELNCSYRCHLQPDEPAPVCSCISRTPDTKVSDTYSGRRSTIPSTPFYYCANNSTPFSKLGFYQATTEMAQRLPCSCCYSCCCCCCCGCRYRSPPNSNGRKQLHTISSPIQPVYYTSNSITCFYKPAPRHSTSM